MRLRVRPPELPGEAEQRRALNKQWDENVRRMRAIDRFANDPAARARATAQRLLEEEARVLASIDATTTEGERARLTAHAAEIRRMADMELKEAQMSVNRDKPKAIRKEFRERFSALAARFKESQSERYPVEFRQTEGAAIQREMRVLEAGLQNDMIVWRHGQQVEAERLRQLDPPLDAAGETRRLRETMEVEALTKQYPGKVQMQNFVLPAARAAIAAGNIAKARVHYSAAQRLGVFDGTIERDISAALDMADPNRRSAVEIEVATADELELSRRAVADAKVRHQIGSLQEQTAASTVVKLADFKRQQEAAVQLRESGIELPPVD